MTRSVLRTQQCSDADARRRLEQARKFLDVAELTAEEGDGSEYSSVSASLAVLGGIAATDAACCKALGRRSRGQDHHQAEDLVVEITPGGEDAAKALRRLLSLKDEAQYGFYAVSGTDLKAAVRQARKLVDFAEDVVRR
jgi:HEPN domain-containing protein